jgi:mxaJ protein
MTLTLALMLPALLASAPPPAHPVLRVCSDPNNLPFSNAREQGFENRLARLLAEDLGAELRYTWWAQRRGFLRNTLKAGSCDVVMGVPSQLEMVAATRPYYRASYVFVARRGDRPVRSLDDPRLRRLRVGVPVVGDDGANPPPAHALARRGIVDNVRGFSVLGDYAQDSPPLAILQALERGDIDLAIVWGPLAGYRLRRGGALQIAPVQPQSDDGLPFAYDISLGTRRADRDLRQRLDDFLVRRRADIDRILTDYGVPRL